MTLPDCPHCSANATLQATGVESRGVRVCVCTCCARVCRVNSAGAVVHHAPTPIASDAHGVPMFDP